MMTIPEAVNSLISELGLNYEYEEYTKSPPVYPYWVGEFQETESMTEDGLETGSFILTCFSRESWQQIEEEKTMLRSATKYGRTIRSADDACVIFYSDSFNLPQESDLKKCQVTLKIKFWKGN